MKLKNNWKKYRHSADPKDLSIFRKFQWICDYGNNPDLWWEIYVGNKPKLENGTSWYRIKNSMVLKISIPISLLGFMYLLLK